MVPNLKAYGFVKRRKILTKFSGSLCRVKWDMLCAVPIWDLNAEFCINNLCVRSAQTLLY